MYLITTTRHLDRPPDDASVRELTRLLDTEVTERAMTFDGLRAVAFLLPPDRSRLYSFTVWPTRDVMLEAEASAQHLDNSRVLEEFLGVTKPRLQHHYQVLSSRNLGTSVLRPASS